MIRPAIGTKDKIIRGNPVLATSVSFSPLSFSIHDVESGRLMAMSIIQI